MKLAVKAALTSATVLASTLGIATSAHATTHCSGSNGNFSFCTNVWYDGTYTDVTVTIASSHYTDFRYTITWYGPFQYSDLAYPGVTSPNPPAKDYGSLTVTSACVKEATLGQICIGPF